MFSRKYPEKQGSLLPQDWTDKAREALNSRFEAFSETFEFNVYGEAHADELLIIVSAIRREVQLSPITFFICADIDEKDNGKKSKKILDQMLDTSELFFEEALDQDDWTGYSPIWLETKNAKETFHYKITRENIYLTIEANKILQD